MWIRTATGVLISSIIGVALTATLLEGCRRNDAPTATAPPAEETPRRADRPTARYPFTDIAKSAGLDFVHFTGSTGNYHMPENLGPGCALFDYDNDGDLDVYLVQGALIDPGTTYKDCLFPPKVPLPPRNRLYRNELVSDGRYHGELRFVDVTETSGTGDTGYGMGVATGDYDNDGDVDLYITNFGGPDVLLRNNGDGTFTDVTAPAGLGDRRWTAGAAFLDMDNDDDLDLVVVAYCDLTVATSKECFSFSAERTHEFCSPAVYRGLPPRLYRNRGNGTFENISTEIGIATEFGHGLGVTVGDFDANGWLDVYVANDGDANQLWMNQGGRFTNQALMGGAALNEKGMAEAGMGVAVADYDDDGDFDMFLTHLATETNTLYENLGGGVFEDLTVLRGLGLSSLPFTSFGTSWFDVDNDADLDLMIANGHIFALDTARNRAYPYDQTNQLFIHEPGLRFVDQSAEAAPVLTLSEVSRGLASGDIDNDGDIDILITNNNGPVRLLRNDLAKKNNWLLLKVIDARVNRDAIGAIVKLTLSDGRVLTRSVGTDGSYLSARDPRIHFGWPEGLTAESLQVTSVDGRTMSLKQPTPGRLTLVTIPATP